MTIIQTSDSTNPIYNFDDLKEFYKQLGLERGIKETCPFCGSDKIYAGIASAMYYHAQCWDCGSKTKSFTYDDHPNYDPDGCEPPKEGWEEYLIGLAVTAWNRRVK